MTPEEETEWKELTTEIGALEAILIKRPDDEWAREHLAKARDKLRKLEKA